MRMFYVTAHPDEEQALHQDGGKAVMMTPSTKAGRVRANERAPWRSRDREEAEEKKKEGRQIKEK